jgi:hypothetical protein
MTLEMQRIITSTIVALAITRIIPLKWSSVKSIPLPAFHVIRIKAKKWKPNRANTLV